MKNKVFTLICLALFTQAMAQSQLSTLIRGGNGVSNKFVTLSESQQVAFSQAQLKSILGLDQNSNLVLKSTEQDQIGYTIKRTAAFPSRTPCTSFTLKIPCSPV
jgi:hypothetical protein